MIFPVFIARVISEKEPDAGAERAMEGEYG